MLEYDHEQGNLFWQKRVSVNTYRGMRAGKTALDGYRYVRIEGKRFLEHRVAWALYYGEWPEFHLDHINTIKDDNRIINLRAADITTNNRNRPRQANNTSGYKGVQHNKRTGKYEARITKDKQTYNLGSYPTALEAHKAYESAARELHGEFARAA